VSCSFVEDGKCVQAELTLAVAVFTAATLNLVAVPIPQRRVVPAVVRGSGWAAGVGALHRNVLVVLERRWCCPRQRRQCVAVLTHCHRGQSLALRHWSKTRQRANQPCM
jgi:hypothetical protein